MAANGPINSTTLTRLIQRFLKCQDHPEMDRLQAQDHLIKLLIARRSLEERTSKSSGDIMNYLASLGPRKVCQYQFKTNDIVWICKECQKDETCVICNECYQASNHEGHDVYFYHSVVGGCCDCGDADAWSSKGFCTTHGQHTHDPVTYIPKDICQVSSVIFDEIAEALLKYASYKASLYDLEAPRRDRPDDPSTVVMMYDEFHTVDEFSALLGISEDHSTAATFQATGSTLLHTGNFEECRSMAEAMQMKGFNVYVGYVSDKTQENRMVAAITFLHQLAVRSDGMCRLICNTLDEDILTRILTYLLQLSKELGRIIYDLLMILMADQSFKVVIAVAYTQAYAKIARLYGRGLGLASQSVYSLSVQFLNRELFVNEICFGHNFLKINVAAVTSLLDHAQLMSQSEPTSVPGNQLSVAMTKALKHSIVLKRRYNPIIGDLKVIFTNRRVARYFLSTSLPECLSLLESFQYVHPQKRALDMHVEYEDQDWMAAFNLNLGISSLFDFLFTWFADADSSCILEATYNGFDSYPDSFTTLKCTEDGWMTEAATPDAKAASSGRGMRSLMRSLSGRVTQYFNPTAVAAIPAHLNKNGAVVPSTEDSAGSSKSPVHKLSSAWKVLHTIVERCFAWERRFRETNGTGITLPPREKTGNTYAQYGESFGEDVQLIDLIQDFALQGVGKLPRLMSFHIPLHRILAHAIFEACKHQHLTACLRSLQGFLAEKASNNEVPLNGTIDIPLFCIVMSTQINLHMWQRNGQCMADQALNYGDFPFCRIYKELDTLLIQFLLTVHPTDQFVSQLFYRFGVAEYVAHRKAEAIGVAANSDASYLPALLDEALKYIVNLVTELPTPSVAHAVAGAKEAGEKAADSVSPSPSVSSTEEARSAKHAWSQNQLYESAGRLLPLVRRELLHKLIGGAATYSQLQECFGIFPEASKLDSDLIDAIITELTVKHDNILHGAPTYTLKKELWAEYDPCFPRVPGSVHQKAFEDRPKITATAPIITKPFVPHECFATVRNHMLLAPVLLRVQRDLLYVAAAERCSKKTAYKAVREKWTLKCNDSIYGKVIQLLTLSIYVTKDLKAAEAAAASLSAAESALYDHASGAATALEKFMLEEIFLPDSESAFNAYLNAVNGTRLPSLLHVLMDIYHANDPLDVNSKHWVQWLIEQTCQLSAESAQSAEKYRLDNGIVTASSTAGGAGAAPAGAKAGGDSKALSAKEKAMQVMQAKAAQFMMMMEGMSDDSDDEDADDAPKPSKAPAAVAESSTEGSSTDASGTVTPQKDGKLGGAEMTLTDHSVTPVPEGKGSDQSQSAVSEEDAVPVCIICQADANAENAEGSMRMLGYLALVQASTLLSHPEGCLDCTTHMRIAENIPSISSKVAPKKLSMECNAQISFCGHGMHNDCFEKYIPSQLRKSTEQSDMVLDQTKLQFCCPLCKKLGNLFMPYVETDPVQIEVREGAKAKLATAIKKKQVAATEADGALTPVPAETAATAASISPLEAALMTTRPAAPVVPHAPAATPFAAVWPDIVVMPKATIPLFPASTASSAMDCDNTPAEAAQLSWTSWINHPSMLNCDSSVFARTRSASVTAVTFDRTITGHERGSALKRARSQTSDSADFGRISTKPNTGAALTVDVGVVPEAAGEDSPLPGARMDEVVEDDQRESGSDSSDPRRDSNDWQAEYMGYSLNDIDLNSTSTDRNVTAAAALEADLHGISIDTVGSLDERESEAYEFLMDFAFNQQEQQDALSELDKARRKQVKILETLRHHSTETMLNTYLKRKAWAAFLEDYVGAVYTDLSTRSAMQLESKINQPSVASYGVIVPLLEAILRSVAYSMSCDLAEHNVPGYHLLTEADLSALSSVAGVSGEKAAAISGAEGAPLQSAASVDLNAAPWMYIKKYSLGMDEYRYLVKTVDALACVLHTFDSVDFVNHSVMLMLSGISSRVAPHSPGKSSAPIAIAAKEHSWLPMPSEMSFSNRAAPTIHTTPLLAAPLLDTLVLCIALSKAAPAGSVPPAPVLSPRGTRHAPRGPPYHPLWNIDHCCRWICLAKLAQLLVLEVEQTNEPVAAGADAFACWPCVAPFVTALLGKVSAERRKHTPAMASGDAVTLSTERAKYVMYQWVAFMRTAAHVLYRNNKELFGKTAASTRPAVLAPAEWLQRDNSGASLLVQSATDVTDQQVRKHLKLMAMGEIISVEGSAGALNSDQMEILSMASRWVSDLHHATETKEHTACGVDVGVSTSVEVTDFLKNDPDVAGAVTTSALVTKLPAVADTAAASGVKQHWAALHSTTLYCYPRISRPALISMPKEYTKLHAMVLSKVSAHRASHPSTAVSADGKAAYENPALCLVCATVVDAAGRGQCAAHAMKCGGESGLYFLLQECQVLLCHGPRSIYFNSPYVDVYGESQHQFRGKPLLLDARRYEALNHLWSTHQIPREVVSKRSTATRIVINNYY